MGPLANPQFDLMTRFVGLMLSDPAQASEEALSRVVADVCDPTGTETTAGIVRLIMDVETAYFSRAGDVSSGEFDFEPLKGENAGDPIYLNRLSNEALGGYGADLELLARRLPALAARCRRPEEIMRIRSCLANVLADVRLVRGRARKS